MHGRMVGCLMCTDKEQEADQASLWRPVLQLPIKVGHLVSLDFLLSCDIEREDATLLLETGVGFFVVATNESGERALIARLPAFWTIFTRVSQGNSLHWLTTLPSGAHTFFALMRLGLPPTETQFVSGVEVIATGKKGHALEMEPMDKTLRWGGIHGPSLLALRSALSGHVILKTNKVLGKRIWTKLKLLYARLADADGKLLANLAEYASDWQTTICCYLLMERRPVRQLRLRAIRDDPLAVAALMDIFGNRNSIGNEILQGIDRRMPVRRLLQAYVGCTRDALRYINGAIGSRFTTLTTLEFDCMRTAAVLQPFARPQSIEELKAVVTELNQIRQIEHLINGVFQLIAVNSADPKAMPNLAMLVEQCRVKGGRSIAKKLKAIRSGHAFVEVRSQELLERVWQNAGAGIRRIGMHSRAGVEMPIGLDLDKLSNLSLARWTELVSEAARAWSGKVTTLGVYENSHRILAAKVWDGFGIAHLDGHPQVASATFSGLPHGVQARQIIGSQIKQAGIEFGNCLFRQSDYFDFKMRQGCVLLVRFEDAHQTSVAELHVSGSDRVSIKQHSGYRGEAASIHHREAAQALLNRVHSLHFKTSAMPTAMQAIQDVMSDVTDESQGNLFRMAELMHVARRFRIVNPPDLHISRLEDDFVKFMQRI